MSFLAIFKWVVDLWLFFIIRGYLRGTKLVYKWVVWSLFGLTVAVDAYFLYWYNFVLGRVPNDYLTAYFGGIILCIYISKAVFISLYSAEWMFHVIRKLLNKKAF